MTRGKLTVTVSPGAVVYVDGRACLAGPELEVTAKDAAALREQGVAH